MRSEFFALANANETQRSSAKWNERTQARKRREQMAQVEFGNSINTGQYHISKQGHFAKNDILLVGEMLPNPR